MIVDHVGYIFFPNVFYLRLIGRIAFPIFAFFVAEGLRHTRSRKKYVITLLVFALISQIPYNLLRFGNLNILFTFLVSIGMIYLIERCRDYEFFDVVALLIATGLVVCIDFTGILDYGLLGMLLVIVFYFFHDTKFKLVFAIGVLLLVPAKMLFEYGPCMIAFVQFANLLTIPLLYFYNGQKGKINLKYLFYVGYPAHLCLLYVLKLII